MTTQSEYAAFKNLFKDLQMKVNVYLMVLTLLHKFCKVSSYRQVLKTRRVQDSACSANKSFTVSSTTSPYSPFQISDTTPYSYHNEGQGEILELEVMAIVGGTLQEGMAM